MTPAYLVDLAVVSSTCEKTLVCVAQLSEDWRTACEPVPRLLQMVRAPSRTAEHAIEARCISAVCVTMYCMFQRCQPDVCSL